MSCPRIWKSASERIDWVIDYSRWLIDGDTLASVEATAPDGLSVDVIHDSSLATIWVSGGDHGKQYRVPIRITSQQGRVLNETMRVRIE